MQRLFSMFPTGAAGIALVLLRLSVAAMLIMGFHRGAVSSQWALAGIALLAAFCLLGTLTPIVCLFCCCLEIAAIFSLKGVDIVHLLIAVVDTIALGLLGPGGYSLDARMFGRRRVILSTDDGAYLP